MIAQATTEVEQKKNPPALSQIRLQSLDEGHALQIMYIGPYAQEAATIARMHAYAADNGYALVGKHHEIYLSDPRKVAPKNCALCCARRLKRSKSYELTSAGTPSPRTAAATLIFGRPVGA